MMNQSDEKSVEFFKTCTNVTFDVLYDDGEKRHVEEGVLLEARGNKMVLHIGTSNANVVFASVMALTEAIFGMGLEDEFKKYLQRRAR